MMVKWRYSRLAILLLLVTAFLVAGYIFTRPSDPSALVLLPWATDVHAAKFKGTDQLQYKLTEAYPAKSALTHISEQLQSQGWKPLKEDYLNPGLPSSHVRGWTRFLDGTQQPEQEVRQWMADWTNARGDVVRYGLKYRWPLNGKEDLKTLSVTAIYIPADLARAGKQAVLKEMEKRKRSGE
ncbi:MAG TPA: hypothetical protein VFI02_18930 [Armatimonadota bacterium]|nr:hypothetical protein [Armatimonadota bacterium]